MITISALGRQRPEGQEFLASLDYIVNLRLASTTPQWIYIFFPISVNLNINSKHIFHISVNTNLLYRAILNVLNIFCISVNLTDLFLMFIRWPGAEFQTFLRHLVCCWDPNFSPHHRAASAVNARATSPALLQNVKKMHRDYCESLRCF